MPRSNLSLPHERRKASLKAAQLKLRVKQAETKEQLSKIKAELAAMSPKKPREGADITSITKIR